MRSFLIYLSLIIPAYFAAQNYQQSLINSEINSHKTLQLLHRTISNYKINHPEYLKSYKQTIYNKFYIDDLIYNYSTDIDSITSPNPHRSQPLFLEEQIAENIYHTKYGHKYSVIAGQSTDTKDSFYQTFGKYLFNDNYPPISKKDFSSYNFNLTDSLTLNQRKTYIISFWSKRNLLLNGSRGTIYIDANSYAVTKYLGIKYTKDYSHYFEYNWKYFQKIWYLDNKTDKIKFNTTDFLKSMNRKKENLSTSLIMPWLILESQTTDFSRSTYLNSKDFKGYPYEFKTNYTLNAENKISFSRPLPLNSREKLAFDSPPSYNDTLKKSTKSYLSLENSELTLGKFNLDLPNLINFNDYEGFRFQIGGKTNSKLSTKYSLNGYSAWSTKDKKVKGSLGADFFIHKKQEGKLSLSFASDVTPFSQKITRLTQENSYHLNEQLNFIQNSIFYSYNSGTISYRQDFLNKFTASVILDYQSQKSRYDYSYHNYSTTHTFNLLSTSLNIKYAPFAQYMQTAFGKLTLKDKPIYFYLDYTKGWKGLEGDFNYHKLDFYSDITLKNKWGTSNLFFNSGYISGKTTLWNLYGNMGNAKSGNTLFNRFSAKGFHSFETLIPGDFFADKYLAFFFTHKFNSFYLWNHEKTFISLVYNGMIGNLKYQNIHSFYNLQTPEKYYQEIGIEFNNLLSHLGVGFYYRLGNYTKSHAEDNLFIKLTFSPF